MALEHRYDFKVSELEKVIFVFDIIFIICLFFIFRLSPYFIVIIWSLYYNQTKRFENEHKKYDEKSSDDFILYILGHQSFFSSRSYISKKKNFLFFKSIFNSKQKN